MTRTSLVALAVSILTISAVADNVQPSAENLLTNPRFAYHAFANHRDGQREDFESHNAAYWNTDAWGDITVVREAHVDSAIRPAESAGALVRIAPGKRVWQFFTLPEAGLSHGDVVSMLAGGHQAEANALRAHVKVMKLDSEDGTWTPADFGMSDKRKFPRHARGELVAAHDYAASSDSVGAVELRIDNAVIMGQCREGNESHSDDINTIGVQVEFENASESSDVWVWSPSLCRGETAQRGDLTGRQAYPHYRHIPRTMQKLWKGEPIHILVMGSSIDRASANPPMYPYDEDPASETFKQPLSQGLFDPALVDRPDLDGYIGEWRHYYSYAGRLRRELMRKFDMPASKICLNFMACDGSCVGEAHSGLAKYCSLAIPPHPGNNGHKQGPTWRELYPGLFERPEGVGPDLVIFGSGANEKTDTPDEVAVFEGAIRWIQRHYTHTEFLFCQFQNAGAYTPNRGDLQALSLRYGIPLLDYGLVADDVTRWCNRYALVPSDGHPQAAAHYLWFKQAEKAFECWDPVVPGQPQEYMPERVHANTYGWEGEMVTYDVDSGRLKGGMFMFDDTAMNCWGAGDESPVPFVDGEELTLRRNSPGRDIRNSLFRHGRCRLGDRHILELTGPNARLTYVDAKVCPGRRFFGADHPFWRGDGLTVTEFASEWGAPCGTAQVLLQPGQTMTIDVVATDLSAAYADAPDGGTLRVIVDGVERLAQPANQPFTDRTGALHFMENRKGILGLGYGWHTVTLEAVDAPVSLLGLFTYDARPNHLAERRLTGEANAGETVTFSAPFRARPFVRCDGDLAVTAEQVTSSGVTFGGTGRGTFEVVGE